MKVYLTDWLIRLAIMTIIMVLFGFPWMSLAIAIIVLLAADLFKYTYRTLGDKQR